MTLRDKVNEVLKENKNNNGCIQWTEIVKMIYVVYKDIEKIKNHLEIK